MYTTIQKVRELSGFNDETLISDSIIKGKISSAEGMFESSASVVYTLPFLYHKQNTITFFGIGSGSGTMAIVINGVTYNVSITSGIKATEVAELFVTAVSGSIHFKVVDSVINDIEKTIVSISSSSDLTTALAQVNITSAPTTQGITATIGTREDRYAPMINQIVAEIAAALLLIDNYGQEAQDSPKDGNTKMKMINETLQKIQRVHESEQVIKLFDEITKTELTISSSKSVSSIPNETTNADSDNPTSYAVSVNSEW